LVKEWPRIEAIFKSALLDLTTVNAGNTKSTLEVWFEILSKIMNMWKTSGETFDPKAYQNQKHFSRKPALSAVDDFYVFIHEDLDS
jgi:hypothetical protein